MYWKLTEVPHSPAPPFSENDNCTFVCTQTDVSLASHDTRLPPPPQAELVLPQLHSAGAVVGWDIFAGSSRDAASALCTAL